MDDNSSTTTIISKTFGGLNKQYYFREFFFGIMILVLFPGASFIFGNSKPTPSTAAFFIINTLLYPYSRYAYERITRFIIGDNIFLASIIVMVFVKLFFMLLCWVGAIFIAPFGLLFLYIKHTHLDDSNP